MKKNVTWKIPLFIALFFVSLLSDAQSIKRQNIGSYGSVSFSEGLLVRQTVGQPYCTIAYYGDKMSIRPGFEQPPNFSLALVNPSFNINLNVYPNPATNFITISTTEVINDVVLQVVNMNGELIINEEIAELKSYSINCDLWSSGSYFVTLLDGEQNKYSSKLIITK